MRDYSKVPPRRERAALATLALPGAASARTKLDNKWSRLRHHLHGRLVLPSEADYQKAKQLYQVQFDDTSPRAVAYCASATDVALCLRFAQDHGIPVAARSGGHSAGIFHDPGLVIDVSELNAVALGNGSVTLGPGAQLIDIMNTLSPSGLGISGGYCPTVAAGGFLQGGGMGLFTRSIGMASDKVTSARVVLANGTVVTASPTQNPDLYWALRGGGGGNFGIVTSYEITPSPHLRRRLQPRLDLRPGAGHAGRLDPVARRRALVDRRRCQRHARGRRPGKVPTAGIFLGSVDTSPAFAAEIQRLISLVGHAPVVNQTFNAPISRS
ncbi:FAD-dependent oxidoreductase [Micromonospora sp. M12]